MIRSSVAAAYSKNLDTFYGEEVDEEVFKQSLPPFGLKPKISAISEDSHKSGVPSADKSFLSLPSQEIILSPIELSRSPTGENINKEQKVKKKILRPKVGLAKKEKEILSYFRSHKINEFLKFLMQHLIVNQPDDIRKFLMDLLDECILYRSGISDKAPTLFQRIHIISIFNSMDPSGSENITEKQYKLAMNIFGIKEYPPILPIDCQGSKYNTVSQKKLPKFISKEDFINNTTLSLKEQLLDIITVPVPSLATSVSSSLSYEEVETSISETIKSVVSTPNLIQTLDQLLQETKGIRKSRRQYHGEGEYDIAEEKEKSVSKLPSKLLKSQPEKKVEILRLAYNPEIIVKVFNKKPLQLEFVDILSEKSKALEETKTEGEGSTIKTEDSALLSGYDQEASLQKKVESEKIIKKKREGKPIISSHSKHYDRPYKNVLKTLEKVKQESRKKLEEQFPFIIEVKKPIIVDDRRVIEVIMPVEEEENFEELDFSEAGEDRLKSPYEDYFTITAPFIEI